MAIRKTLAGVCATLIIACISSVQADELVQYLFWDSIGNTVGKGVQSYFDYKAEGTWTEVRSTGAAEFPLDDSCNLTNGRWGRTTDRMSSHWRVRGRLE